MNEVWKDVIGYEGAYQVSDTGRVRSLDRFVGHRSGSAKRKGKVLKPIANPGGYLQVVLSKKSLREPQSVHRLVVEAFIGPCPPGMEVCHGAKGQKCNYVTNLRYGTSKDNSSDTIKAGRTLAKAVIRSDGKKYRSLTEAAIESGCFDGEICQVCKGKLKAAGGYGWSYYKKGTSAPKHPDRPRKIRSVTDGIKIFESITAASKETGASHISACCLGKRKTSGGKVWRFV